MLHLRRLLVHFQLLAVTARVSQLALSLSTGRGNDTFNSSGGHFVSGPVENQSVEQDGFTAAVTDLLLDLRGDIESTVPNLDLGDLALESCLSVSIGAHDLVFGLRTSKDSPSAKGKEGGG